MAAAGGGASAFAFRPLRKPEEYRHGEELQREALGLDAALAVPAALLRTVQETGGLVLGAFVDIYLAGLTVSSLGWDGTTLYHRSLVTAVRPEYQNHRVGFRLMALERDEVLRLGLAEVRWAFDPLRRDQASLAIRHLGARPEAYLPNQYGQVEGVGGARDETDRLTVRWKLASTDVEQRLSGALPTPEEAQRRHSASFSVLETEAGESGLRLPASVSEPTGPSAALEIPFDLASIRTHEPGAVRRWRHAVRDGFRAALELGYAVDDFAAVSLDHERRAFYFLAPAPPDADRPPSVRR